MAFLTEAEQTQLLDNGTAQNRNNDHFPVVRLFTPDAAASWLLSRMNPALPGLAYGLCDLGLGCPELGSIALEDLAAIRGKNGLSVERDESFTAQFPMSVYAKAAYVNQRITLNENLLKVAAQALEENE